MDQWSSLPLMLTKNAWQKTKSIKHLDSLVRRLTGHWISCIKPKTYSNQFEYPAIYVCVCVNVTNSQVYLCFASHLNLNHQPLLPCFSIEINEKIVNRSFFNSLTYVFLKWFSTFLQETLQRCILIHSHWQSSPFVIFFRLLFSFNKLWAPFAMSALFLRDSA